MILDNLPTLILMFICLMMEGFFSGSEIAVISADKIKLRHIAAKGSRGAKLALKMLKTPEWLPATALVGTNVMVVTNTTLATALTINLLG
jgi:Mg2+/Co2+ transporter CorB